MASGSTAPFSGEFSELENVPKLPEGISAEQIFEQNADAIRQAAESRHAAGLSQVNADGGFFDAFVNQNKISSLSNAVLNSNSIQLENNRITGFEDGKLTFGPEWNSFTDPEVSNSTSNPINGNNSLEIFSSNAFVNPTISRNPNFKPNTLSFKIESTKLSSNSSDDSDVRLQENGGDTFAEVTLAADSHEVQVNSTKVKDSFSANEVIKVTLKNIDFSAETFDVFINDTKKADSIGFQNSASGFGRVKFVNVTNRSGISRTVRFDDLLTGDELISSSGTVSGKEFTFSDTQGNAFSPSKVGIFPEQNLNGQSISYDLKDSTGTLVKTFNQSDLNQLQSVNTTDTTFQVEANFSGNGSQTPELEFLDVRGV